MDVKISIQKYLYAVIWEKVLPVTVDFDVIGVPYVAPLTVDSLLGIPSVAGDSIVVLPGVAAGVTVKNDNAYIREY